MLKETENEETTLLSLVAFRLRESGPLSHPPGYAYNFETRSRPQVLS